jgi:hypothetical protein
LNFFILAPTCYLNKNIYKYIIGKNGLILVTSGILLLVEEIRLSVLTTAAVGSYLNDANFNN